MAYGRVKFDSDDLNRIRRVLAEVKTELEAKIEASDGDEQAFYVSVIGKVVAMSSRFASARPGRMAFAETELKDLSGLFSSEARHLVEAFKHAPAGPERVAAGEELDSFNAFKDRLSAPFLRDTSQDAEPDEDEDEDDEELESAAPLKP